MNTSPNPLEVIGGNFPPIETAIDRANPIAEELGRFLSDNPVLTTEDEARDQKEILDRVALALKAVEAERKTKVEPLNAELKATNAVYHQLHNTDGKRPGTADKLVNEAWSRLGKYALKLERQRFEAEQAARRIEEAAAEEACRAADAEAEAREAASAGVCDVDLAGA